MNAIACGLRAAPVLLALALSACGGGKDAAAPTASSNASAPTGASVAAPAPTGLRARRLADLPSGAEGGNLLAKELSPGEMTLINQFMGRGSFTPEEQAYTVQQALDDQARRNGGQPADPAAMRDTAARSVN
ncbi:hypothetical protein [Tahibacter amnicola]|uniref:Beta-barrel assembly complex subunit BamF n=1 Tax=Tahibacter amnicola TaxID=2976241 RepID=A0ABY6BIA4_9GAMM|nr:hypothetical protein [Tahibacter amnicola]UXI68351.1 hypothetical protein N4264_01485 [Tahibacter amnicola]